MAHALETISPEQLQTIRILEELPLTELEDVSAHATLLHLTRRTTVYSPETSDEGVYLLLSGKVKLFHMSDEGREVIVDILQGGDVFGELQSFDGVSGMWAEALGDCEVALLPCAYFDELMRESPGVAIRLVEEMSQRLQQRASQIEDLALRNVPSRVANALLKLGESHGVMGREGITIDLRLTHQDIANMVAASRETVTTVLVDMREGGLIEIDRKHVRISNLGHLQDMAKFN